MKRLTTNDPQDNVQTALNLFYIKNQETWVRGGGPWPEYPDVSLFDFTRMLIRGHIPTVKIPEDDNEFSCMMAEWLFDDADSAEGTIATLYTAAWAFAELRQRLMGYEDIVVFCEDCEAHGRCAAEQIYQSEGIEKPFCCRGKAGEQDG